MRADGRPEPFIERRHALVFVVLLASGVLLTTIGVKSPERLGPFEKVGMSITGPLARASHGIGSLLGDGWAGFASTWSAHRELGAALTEVRDLRLLLMDREALHAENERLRRLLGLAQQLPMRAIPAEVVDRTAAPDCVLLIDRGTDHGAHPDLPVISPDGVVGKVLSATATMAKVQCVIDPDAGVAVRVGDDGAKASAIVKDASGRTCRLRYLESVGEIVEGDRVVTSGLDQIYPRGLLLGRVIRVVRSGPGQEVVVEPAVDFRRLDAVVVLRPDEEASVRGHGSPPRVAERAP
jgi:rod shape-determining protein MreC